MSDENTPKLRLRPKLAGGPPPVSPPSVNPPVPAEPPAIPAPSILSAPQPVPQPAPPAAKPAGLRPKLVIKPDVVTESAPGAFVSPPGPKDPPSAFPSSDPRSFPPPQAKPTLSPSSLRPKVVVAPLPAETPSSPGDVNPPFPPPSGQDKFPAVLDAPPPLRPPAPVPQETWPSVLDAPPPPGLAQAAAQRSEEPEAEPAEITAIRKASTYPFPAPTAKFPPLPGLGNSADSAPPEPSEAEGFLKKLLLIGGLALVLLVGGGVFAYFRFFAKPAPDAAPKPVPTVSTPPSPADQKGNKLQETIKKVAQEQAAPLNEVVAAETPPAPATSTAAASPAASEPAAVATPPPAVVQPPPPPPPSMAFKSWVINLRIRGVRGGDAQRVFIDRTSYVPGDLVNPQLGIFFVGYDEDTRMLKFQDKTGASFERRH